MSKIVYTAHSSLTINRSKDIAIFTLRKGYVPIDPFLALLPEIYEVLGYTHDECVNTDINVLAVCDELWVFGDVSLGVSMEIDWWLKNRGHKILERINWDEVPYVFTQV